MYPTLFVVGKWHLPTYTLLLDLGLILALVITYLEGRRVLDSGEAGLDLGLWAVIGGILGGRLGYVLANWGIFAEDWGRVVRIWEGGLAFHGAFFGGVAVVGLFALLQRRRSVGEQGSLAGETWWSRFLQLGDLLTPGLVLATGFGWLACLMGGCAYGAVGQGFGYLILPDLFGVEAPRFATQVVGLAWSLLLFVVFWLLRRRWPFAGGAFLMFVLFYFAGQFFLEFSRGDEAIYFGPWRLAQLLDLALVLLAALGLLLLWWQASRAGTVQEDCLPEEGLPVEDRVG
jgi:phosphatidylglycerol---prolipoprotein diacylglyceryl transferase